MNIISNENCTLKMKEYSHTEIYGGQICAFEEAYAACDVDTVHAGLISWGIKPTISIAALLILKCAPEFPTSTS